MASTPLTPWQNVRRVHREWADFYRDLGSLSLVGLFVILGLIWFVADRTGYTINVYTEALSVIATIIYLDQRAERRQVRALQDQLVREAGGRANDRAAAAIDHMRDMDWLHLMRRVNFHSANLNGADLSRLDLSGLDFRGAELNRVNLEASDLRGANLERANLSGARLNQANLNDATLAFANLTGANLLNANLRRAQLNGTNFAGANLGRARLIDANLREAVCSAAVLMGADLTGADVQRADLRKATFVRADLQAADLSFANLEGAFLLEANLSGARFSHARFDNKTVLPDPTINPTQASDQAVFDNYWTPNTDMARYTNPDHPNFWRSNDRYSPAYRGNNIPD